MKMTTHRLSFQPSPAEVIRAGQKDETYIDELISTPLFELVQSLFGYTTLLHHKHELEMAANILYFFLTTYSGYQTIGEEYINLVQLDKSKEQHHLSSKNKRMCMILLHCCVPYCLHRILKSADSMLEAHSVDQSDHTSYPTSARFHDSGQSESVTTIASVQSANTASQSDSFVRTIDRRRLQATLRSLRKLLVIVHRLHLVYFYISQIGSNHLAKRLLNIRYVRSYPSFGQLSSSYRWLGYLSLIPLIRFVYDVTVEMRNTWSPSGAGAECSQVQSKTRHFDFVSTNEICALCMELTNHSTATPCGHVFCWYCIHNWCQQESQCPICRQTLEPSRLVYLRNF